MSGSQAAYRGRVQAQGDDIEQKGGYSCAWAQDEPITDREGLALLAKIEEQCSEAQQKERKQAFAKARRFIENASAQGGVGPEAQPHSFQNHKSKRAYPNSRVDIEIRSGITFIPAPERE